MWLTVDYRPRSVDPLLTELLSQLPAILIVGPRATGKTTTAARHCKTVVHLDSEVDAAAFRADPDVALRGLDEPVLLDEWQAVPEVLGAVKRAVDSDPRAGRFVLTGSIRADLEMQTWPGTGRLVRLDMRGLTVAERLARPTVPLADRVLAGVDLVPSKKSPDVLGYLELALVSGFPQPALALSGRPRELWFESYLDQVVTRDAPMLLGERRDPERLRRYLRAYALNSAGLVADKTIYDAANINRRTALAYEQLLSNLLITESVPAWTSNRLKRLGSSPKRYLGDSALLASAIEVTDPQAILRSGDLLGRMIDTFVASQLRAERTWASQRSGMYHLREESGAREVDLIVEAGGDRVIAIEVKATGSPKANDVRHLSWLREKLGDRFVGGVLLHTGPRSFQIADNITAAPISTLWA
ncbi:MAG: ATP-binding protein [Acidimicrobiales bacterium]